MTRALRQRHQASYPQLHPHLLNSSRPLSPGEILVRAYILCRKHYLKKKNFRYFIVTPATSRFAAVVLVLKILAASPRTTPLLYWPPSTSQIRVLVVTLQPWRGPQPRHLRCLQPQPKLNHLTATHLTVLLIVSLVPVQRATMVIVYLQFRWLMQLSPPMLLNRLHVLVEEIRFMLSLP